jgi:predicted alpha/beta superfamily hydrolase
VNISHGETDTTARRERDFTPTRVVTSPQSGGAAQFLAFLEQELMPLIDRTYRTNPADRALLGHSYGGLFAVYTLLHRPQLFQRIVAASPSLGWDKGVLCQEAAKLLPTLPFQGRIDFSYGSEEDGEEAAAQVRPFFEALERTKPAGMDYRYTIYPGESHNSVRPFSFSSGLAWVYRGWKK